MTRDQASPPYRIETRRLTLRCFQPEDVEPLHAAFLANRDHLGPWLPWARDEAGLAERIGFVRRARGKFDLAQDFSFGIFLAEGGELIGGTGLHPRCGPGGIEVGYWIDRRRLRQGLATEAAGALTRVAVELLEVARVEIRCDPANGPSLGVARRLGFTSGGVLRATLPWHDGGYRDTVVWTLLADELARTPAGAIGYEAFDFIGRKVSRPRAAEGA